MADRLDSIEVGAGVGEAAMFIKSKRVPCGLLANATSAIALMAGSAYAPFAHAQAAAAAPASQPTAAATPPQATESADGAVGGDASAAPAPQPAGADIVVTGSRVIRNGYQAPTPVSVLSGEALAAIAPTNIADAVNRLPALSGSTTPRSQPTGITSGALGVNQLNLRGLGTNRTLVLLDGKRIVNSSAVSNALYSFAAPDVNTVPNALVSRVEVVTGGASAAYGSDALAGVTNFVIDHKFTGLRATVQGGGTTRGDDGQYLLSFAAGHGFADDRGHALVSAEYAYNAGISGSRRPWNRDSAVTVVNPAYTATNGQPYLTLARQVGVSNGTPGGLITAGPLRGVVFGPGGTPGIFNFGTVAANNVMIGGDWQASRIDDTVDLDARSRRLTTYGRVSYDLADDVEFYAEGQYSRTRASSTATPNRRLGNLTIRSDNAFIPAAVATRLAALNLTSLTLGTTNGDIGNVEVDNTRELSRWAAGIDGKVDLLGSSWSWDAYYQQSRNVVVSSASNVGITANYLLAVDAVRNPATGAIVCRSSLANPNNGCVPYNPMGTGVNDARAIGYVTGTAQRRDVLGQDVAAFDVNGKPFSTWAGPVSLAFGVEHRRETLNGRATALDEANAFFTGNYHASKGSYQVTEGFAEVAVPLAKDTSWAKSLDLNGAVRATDYSTSGYVTTWKLGAVYAPVSDIRFRGTLSRDIRAPSVGELFSAGNTTSGGAINDPLTNTNVSNSFALSIGNPNLKPEKADSRGIGVVLSPSFLPGLQGSIDFYSIKIKDAIATPGIQTVINLCYGGATEYCQYITRTNNVITTVRLVPSNIQAQSTRGLDFDVSYRMPLAKLFDRASGVVQLHGLATYVISLKTAGTNGTVEGAGVLGSFTSLSVTALTAPRFRSTLSASYGDAALDVTATWRHVGGGVYSHDLIGCNAGACPTGSTATISSNRIKANNLFDLGIAYRPLAAQRGFEMFLAVDNVFDAAPPLIYGVTGDGYYQGQANFAYDRIGRTFRAGIRIKL